MMIGVANDYFVRVAEIIVDVKYLQDYKKLLKEGVEASMKLEDGVILLYPVVDRQRPNYFYVLEIYANKKAYQQHIKTDHFLKYKRETEHMVLKLELIDVNPLVFVKSFKR
ncbi:MULTISPECIES: putative quinol monooxygenase [unclassified Helicobacter]|uniref:putative quinol monooxygenase n=1 Tax=unclassified Helicobacter TaxID=2593540 RepID=UPI0018F7EB33|nr:MULTISPECIES: antibiotic biosynthesis monooxygenase [unclassified Helicobacter]